MLQLDNINDFEWRRLVERLDRGVAEAARNYLSQLHARLLATRLDLHTVSPSCATATAARLTNSPYPTGMHQTELASGLFRGLSH